MRLPAVIKHGAFSAMTLMPGEDATAYEQLHAQLVAELCPAGVLEEDYRIERRSPGLAQAQSCDIACRQACAGPALNAQIREIESRPGRGGGAGCRCE